LGSIHYLWLVKADTRQPLIYLSILLGLLAFRLPWSRWAHALPGRASTAVKSN
jgi:sulfoxide reductase heme-binding subunit YedZ